MTRTSILKSTVRLASLAAGLLAAAAVLSASAVPAGRGALGAELLLNANSTGELAVDPAGAPFLRARDLRPSGHSSEGALVLANQTSRALDVRVRSRPHDRSLDQALSMAVNAGKARIFSGPMGRLRHWSAGAVTIPAGERVRLTLKTWVPPSARRWQNRLAESTLELQAVPR